MNDKEDDDISIDFSKVKGFFKKKEEKKSEPSTKESNEKGEDIEIDFGKIKNLFKPSDDGEKVESKAEASPKKSDNEKISLDAGKLKTPENSESSDDGISMDFSKIKSFFKSEKEDKKALETAQPKDDEAISLDFSRIKNIFKSGSRETGNEELDFDWSKPKDFFVKYGIVFLALIPIILSIYVRMQAGSLAFTDNWARDTIINGLRSQIRGGINQQFPNLPDANKNVRVEAELQKYISSNKAQIDQTIAAYSNSFKSFFQDDKGNNYMPDIDPYYWVRYAQNIVDHGHPGDILKEGRPFDSHQLAPIGRFVTFDTFHSYSVAYFYKILSFFSPELTLMRSSFYLPVFISALCVLLVFFIARKIAGNGAGFFAAMMMAINAAFLGRTLFGHADNDGWVILFPLLITWLFITTIDAKSLVKVAIISLLAGLFTGMFTFAWSGWWYIFDFLSVTIAITLAYLIIINFNEIRKDIWFVVSNSYIKNIFAFGIVYFLSTAFFTTIFSGWTQFRNSFLGPLSFPSIKAPVTITLWPNVLTTVAELNEGSINGIINSMGGPFLFFVSLAGLILAVSRKEGGMKRFDVWYAIATILFYGAYFAARKMGISISLLGLIIWVMIPIIARIIISVYNKDHSHDYKMSILLSLWIVSTIFASIRGIRFTLLLAPAFSVAFGVALGRIYEYLSMILSKELKIHKMIGSGILVILLLLIYIGPTQAAIRAASSDIPIVNDAWYNTLIAINKASKPNAIITSWWDFGHHFKAIADRPVTFDGTTQTAHAAHWVGKFFMTDNEQQAIGILRMLDCGSSKAFTTLNEFIGNNHLSLSIINKIILMDKASAEKELSRHGLDRQQIEEVLLYTHCVPPEGYVIASEDMIGKSGVWSHFGSWNFEKADIWYNARNKPQEEAVKYIMDKFNYTRDRAENTYFDIQAISSDSEANSWIAPWPGYGGTASCTKNSDGIYLCSGAVNGLQVNMSSYDVFGTGQQGIIRPKVVAFTAENGTFKKEFNGSTLDVGLTLIPKNENELEVVVSSKELAGSMFTRMFYMQGHGLKYFDLVGHQTGLTGSNIYTYKVDWEGKNATIVDAFVKKPAEEKTDGADENELIEIEPTAAQNNS